LLWQGGVNFYIVSTNYKRQFNKQNKFRADVIPLTKLKEETSFLVNFTIPIHDLFDLEDFMNLFYNVYIFNLFQKYADFKPFVVKNCCKTFKIENLKPLNKG